jgi:hypothetical protein
LSYHRANAAHKYGTKGFELGFGMTFRRLRTIDIALRLVFHKFKLKERQMSSRSVLAK